MLFLKTHVAAIDRAVLLCPSVLLSLFWTSLPLFAAIVRCHCLMLLYEFPAMQDNPSTFTYALPPIASIRCYVDLLFFWPSCLLLYTYVLLCYSSSNCCCPSFCYLAIAASCDSCSNFAMSTLNHFSTCQSSYSYLPSCVAVFIFDLLPSFETLCHL